jgi:hypothetical protein
VAHTYEIRPDLTLWLVHYYTVKDPHLKLNKPVRIFVVLLIGLDLELVRDPKGL